MAEEELERTQKVFDEINVDLQEELPSLWNSRVGFYVNTFQSVAGLEEKFHREMGKLNQSLYDNLIKVENQETRKTGGRGARTTPASTRSGPDGANHTLGVGPPPIPKSPSKLRPAVPPPPKVTPSKEMKTENIINLFDEASTPNISVTSPTQFDAPGAGNLLDMDLDSLSAISPGAAIATSAAPKEENWDSWEQDESQQPAAAAVVAAVDYTNPDWGDDPTNPNWGDDDPTQPNWDDDKQAQQEDPTQSDWGKDEPAPDTGYDEAASAAAVTAISDEGAVDEGAADEGGSAEATDDGTAAQPVQEDGEQQAVETPEVAPAAEPAAAAEAAPPVEATESADAAEMPPGFIFKVMTMHDYNANDSDELELKAGDVVLVMTYDNPDEQDDGWLMGVRESEWQKTKDLSTKGVFPENFTQRL
ncbi:hypothetical protein AALO_G00044420 [Alosa alosa]|uniref:SH3 domain-containing protein n=1 Tax=Alosa alosa TaxID=278164 RepID=A0AAV6HCC1_9TELE|nr:hypothetical protein AALO_G00044420 [Alosa alosa]